MLPAARCRRQRHVLPSPRSGFGTQFMIDAVSLPTRRFLALLVEERLALQVTAELEQYTADLAVEGFLVRCHPVAADTPPEQIRGLLIEENERWQGCLAGALLVGRVPAARANKNAIARATGMPDEAPPDAYWHAHPCDLYYMNLCGRWTDQDGDGVLDAWTGDRRADIWVSRVRADTVASAYGTDEAQLVRRYFVKNHAYRRGQMRLPCRQALVAWHTIDVLRSQIEEAGWGCNPGLLYGPAVEVFGGLDGGAAAAEGFQRLLADPEGYELGVVNCKTRFDYHNFDEGGYFPWQAVQAAEPKRVLWYHMLTSEPGRHDQENYLAGIYLFSSAPTLALFCGTQHSGVCAAPTLYPDLAAGRTFGDALRNAANYEVVHWAEPFREYVSWSAEPDHRTQWRWGHALPAAVLHGDGTLRLPPWHGYDHLAPRANAVFAGAALAGEPPAHERVAAWDVWELPLRACLSYDNPFHDVTVTAVFTAHGGERRVSTYGFHDGGDVWRVRFAPDREGAWNYRITSDPPDPGLVAHGELHCGPPAGHGFVEQHAQNPYAFQHSDGTPFFHLGDTCYSLTALARATQRLPYLHRRRQQGFSHVRFQIGGGRFGNSPMAWPFGGSTQQPALDRYNPAYFQRVDGLLADMRDAGLGAEVILLDYYQPPQTSAGWISELEEAYLRYILARYAAYSTIIYWTIANEYEVYPDGAYRLDEGSDPAWAVERARLVRSLDPYRSTTAATVHPFSDARVYELLFASSQEISPLLVQEHGEETEAAEHLWDGSGAGLETKLLSLRKHGKPVVDGEFGYETNGYSTHGCNVTTDLQRRQAWRVFLSGCWAATGFRSTVWNHPSITWDLDNCGGLGQWQMSHLARFFREHVRYWELDPAPELVSAPNLCAAVASVPNVVYLPEGGLVTVDLSAARQSLTGFWYNPRTGEFSQPFGLPPGGACALSAPDREDWVLLLALDYPASARI